MTRPRRFNVRSPGGPPTFVCLLPPAVLELVRARGTCMLAQLCVDGRTFGTVASDDVQHVVDDLVRAGELVRVVLGTHREARVAYTLPAEGPA